MWAYVLDDHDEEGKLDGEGLFGVDGASNVVGGDIGAHDFEDWWLNVGVSDSLDVTVSDILVPDLERLRSILQSTINKRVIYIYPME